jgi:hypothetical protein
MELYIIIGLLTVIAISEGYRTYYGFRSSSKAEHFKAKLKQTRILIWDLQFKVFKTREIREDIRQEYDYVKARIENLKNQIATFPADKDPGDKARLEDDKVRAEGDEARFLKQMEELDLEIEGSKPTAEYPNGVEGVTHQIDSLRELDKMLVDYLKEL